MTEIQDKDLPCYECLCLAICRWKSLSELESCNLVYDFLRLRRSTGTLTLTLLPYDSQKYDILLKFMRIDCLD